MKISLPDKILLTTSIYYDRFLIVRQAYEGVVFYLRAYRSCETKKIAEFYIKYNQAC